MKELLQAVDIEKCIAFWKKGIASLIICSMLMIDVAKAMDSDEDDPRLSSNIHRTPSSTPAADLRNIDDGSSEQSSTSTDEDLSPRSANLITGRDIIGSKPNSDDSGSSTSSPEKSPPEGNQGLPIIPFSAFSPSSSRNIISVLSPSSFPCELQPDFGTPPGAESFPDRVPLRSPKDLPGARRTSSRSQEAGSSEKDPLLSSGSSSYGSSHSNSSHSSSQSSDSSSDAEEDVELGREGHPQPANNGLQGTLEQFLRRFASTQPLQSSSDHKGSPLSRWKSTSNVIDLRDNEILENGEAPFLVGQGGNHSIQSQGPGDDELSVDFDLDGDENASPSSHSRFLPTCLSEWFSDRSFWPVKPTYHLPEGALDRASQFLDPLRSRQAAETHGYGSDEGGERSTSSSSDSSAQNSPTFPRHAAAPPPDSESDGEGVITQLLPPTYPHDSARDYSSFRGMLSSSQPLLLQGAWLQILDGLEGETKTQLTNFTNKVINGETTWAGLLGKWVIGPLTGAGFAYGMGPVFSGGLDYLAFQNSAFYNFLSGNAGNAFVWYITLSALEGIFRDSQLGRKGMSYLFFPGKKEVGRMCIAGGIAFFIAFTPVAWLILTENQGRQIMQLPNWDNQFGITVAACGPPLGLDAFANSFKNAWEAIPELQGWCRQFREVFSPSSLPAQIKSPEETLRENFDHNLLKLKRFLAGASDTLIEKMDNDIQEFLDSIHIPKDKKAAAVLAYLLFAGDQVQKVTAKNSKKSISEISFDCFKYTSLILGAPTVALLLQLVGSTVASLFTSNTVADSIGEGFALVAFLPFNYILTKYMNNFQELILNTDPRGHESHPAIRWPVKIFIGIQSLLYLFQTSIAVLQSYQKWFGEGWWPFAAGIPFFIPKFMELVCNFNGSFNEQITTSVINLSHRIGGRCRGESLCTPCKKDKLIRFVESSRGDLEYWNPKLIHDLAKGIKIFKDKETDS